MDHGDYSILFFESTARDFLLGFFLVLPLLFRAAIKVCTTPALCSPLERRVARWRWSRTWWWSGAAWAG